MKNIRTLAVLNALFFLLHFVPSQLTQLELFNSQTIGEVSAKYPALFTPAGITFAIWGVIYLALFAFCIYHLVKAYKADAHHEANEALTRIGYLFILNNLATGLWTIAWVYEQLLLSVVLMLIQLVTLLGIHLCLGTYDPSRSLASKWFTQFPLSIYFGWICIATIANISAALVGLNWDGFGIAPETWTVIMIIVASLLTLFVVLNRRNPFVGLVTVWALYGIVLKHQELNAAGSPTIIATAWAGLIVVALAVVYQFYQNMQMSASHDRKGYTRVSE